MVGYDNLIMGPGIPGLGKDGLIAGDERFNNTENAMEKEEAVCTSDTGASENAQP